MSKARTVLIAFAFLTVVLILWFSAVDNVSAAPAYGNLTVTVLDGSSYSAVSGVTVSITGPQNRTETTAHDGTVVFINITEGMYLVTAEASCFPMNSPQTVRVVTNTSLTLLYGHTQAFFTYTPDQPIVNETVQFDGSKSTSTGTIISYAWDFGDGANGANKIASHTYAEGGEYKVSLTVTSSIGAATYTQTVRIPTDHPDFNILFLLGIPLLLPFILLFLWLRRRRYCVVIQAKIPPSRLHPHCPGTGDCDNCNLTPC